MSWVVKLGGLPLAFGWLALAGCHRGGEVSGHGGGAAGAADASSVAVELPKEISFNRHIQPILSENCYHCHGPDSATRQPKEEPLRLDRPEDAFAVRKSTGKPVIIKGDPAASRLVELIHHPEPDRRMPPPEAHKSLKPGEMALLEKWIKDGANYEPHWAFIPPKRPALPAATRWSNHPIDRLVAARMATAGLTPNPPEEPRRFLRRLTFDLTGLAPEPAALDAFEQACAKDADGAVAEAAARLLATPASAEHFARQWLDAARYADTHGIHIDNYRAIWPFRDWVIRAFEANMPWDQFTTEQLAGDLLPDATLDQRVATGFNRCMPTTSEGGAIPEEYQAIYALDQVSTTSAVWLGLTTGCASCHDHKFDPITMRDFYSLTAFFRNTTMNPMDGNIAEHKPLVFVPSGADRERFQQVSAEVQQLERQLGERRKQAHGEFEQWLAGRPAAGSEPRALDPSLAVHLPLDEADGPLHGLVAGVAREWPAAPPRVAGPAGKAAVLSAAPIDLGDLASFARGDQVSYGGFIRIEGTPTGAVVARLDPANGFRGWDLWLQDGRPGSHVIDTWDSAASKVVAKNPLEPGRWTHVMVTFDGKQPSRKTLTVYVDGVRQEVNAAPNKVGGAIETPVPLRLGARAGDESRLNGPVAMQDFRFYRRLLSQAEIHELASASVLARWLATPAEKRTKADQDALYDYFLTQVDPPSLALRAKLASLRREDEDLRARGSATLVMEEKPNSEAFAHILLRGSYANKGERVTANTPAALPPMAADAPRNRLGLARWLVDPANPLPARVTMNRAWYYLFGTGIVETIGDFGVTGARPSNPELLDWLASEFVARGWNYREMIQLIVTSQTYRQSAAASGEKLETDPGNRLLSRGPRLRLDAEELRDLALESSGLLVRKVGGPSVKPYQPEGIWEAVAMSQSDTKNYVPDSGEKLYRRSLYTFWKRTAAPPSLEIMNAPTREVTCVQRERTNTPLQALVLLNDPQYVEAFRVLAAAAIASAKDFDARLDFISQRVLGRRFAADERAVVKQTLDRVLATYQQKPDEAAKLLSVGAAPQAEGLDRGEQAAWTVVVSQLFNLDETVTH